VRHCSVFYHAHHSPTFLSRRFLHLSFSCILLLSVLVFMSSTYELRFPPRGSREREPCLRLLYFPSPVLSFARLAFTPSHTRTCTLLLLTRTSRPKKLPSTKFPITHSCLGIYPTQHSFTKHHPHFLCLHFLEYPSPFFSRVIIMCSLFLLFHFWGAISIFFLLSLHCCCISFVSRRTFHFLPLRSASQQSLCPIVIYVIASVSTLSCD